MCISTLQFCVVSVCLLSRHVACLGDDRHPVRCGGWRRNSRVALSSLFVVHLNLDGGFYLVSQLDVFALYLRCIVTAHAAVLVGYVCRPCNAPSNSFSAPPSRLLLSAPTEQTKSRVLLRGRGLGLSWRLTQPRLTTPGCFLCLCAMLRRAQVPAPSTTIRLLLIASASSCW